MRLISQAGWDRSGRHCGAAQQHINKCINNMPLGVSLAVHLTLRQTPPLGETGPYEHELKLSAMRLSCWLRFCFCNSAALNDALHGSDEQSCTTY